MDVLDVVDRMHELSRAITGLVGLLYGQEPINASGGEIASLLMLVQREVVEVSNVITAARLTPVT